jgi:hypothetical protein
MILTNLIDPELCLEAFMGIWIIMVELVLRRNFLYKHILKWFSIVVPPYPGHHDFKKFEKFDSALQQELLCNSNFSGAEVLEKSKIKTNLILQYTGIRTLPCEFKCFWISGSWEEF